MALRYRDKLDWTRRAFKALGEDASTAEEKAELVIISPDGRPDRINGTEASFGLDDIPTEAIVGVSVALVLLVIIM